MKSAALGIVSVLLSTNIAFALDKFSEYRILGSEIVSVKIVEVGYEEPSRLVIELKGFDGETQNLILESDELFEECLQNLDSIAGSKSSYAQIVIHETAQTLNGIMHTQCSVFHFPHIVE